MYDMYSELAFRPHLEGLANAVDRRISEVLAPVEPPLLKEALGHASQGGKHVRPILVMASASAAGGSVNDALDPAVAVELLHTSSLIHDDIMDQSLLRRGRPTLYAQYGVSMAVLAGDALTALAFRLLQECTIPRKQNVLSVFAEAFVLVCEGQAFDLSLARGLCVDAASHRKMVEKKTAKLLEASSAIGAMVGTADDRLVNALKKYGFYLGMAYQAKDDLLDVVGNVERLGKPVGSDRKNGKHTYAKLADREVTTMTEESATISLKVSALVEELTAEALSALDCVPASPAREHLRKFAELLVTRDT
jgi:geranylgeranyl pyrophosphate synthase